MKHSSLFLACLLLAVSASAQNRTADPNPDFKVLVNTSNEPVADGFAGSGHLDDEFRIRIGRPVLRRRWDGQQQEERGNQSVLHRVMIKVR